MIRYIPFEKEIVTSTIEDVATCEPGFVKSIKILPISKGSSIFPIFCKIEIYDTGASEEKILLLDSLPKYIQGYNNTGYVIGLQIPPAEIVINHNLKPGHTIGIRFFFFPMLDVDFATVKGYFKYIV